MGMVLEEEEDKLSCVNKSTHIGILKQGPHLC